MAMVATDLFYHNDKTYIIAVDYYSRFYEIAPLKATTTENTISHLKSFFCRHGIPGIVPVNVGPSVQPLHSPNLPKNGVSPNLTSSPYCPQSNGEVERAVKIAKNLIT